MDPKWIPVLVAFIVAIPPTLAVLVDIWLSIHNRDQLKNIHVNLNGRLQEWLQQAEQRGFVAGVKTATESKVIPPGEVKLP